MIANINSNTHLKECKLKQRGNIVNYEIGRHNKLRDTETLWKAVLQ